ncbi:MAG: (d)CMP kinase [Erysipelotrichales bacterium]
MEKEIIAIDGPAASGKSTVAKQVAQKLGYKYIDSGAMYRCLTLYALDNNIEINSIVDYLSEIKIEFGNNLEVFMNDIDVSNDIRSLRVTKNVAKLAAIKEVREYLVAMQQGYGVDKGIVMDGRDIGSVVFKDAKVKIYQIASVEARAQRRYEEDKRQGRLSSLEEIKADIEQRDYEDINREVTPLVKAEDAVELDTSNMSVAQSVDAVIEIFNEKVK